MVTVGVVHSVVNVVELVNDEFPDEWTSASYWKKSNAAADGSGSSSAPSADAQVEGASSALGHLSLASAAVSSALRQATIARHSTVRRATACPREENVRGIIAPG